MQKNSLDYNIFKDKQLITKNLVAKEYFQYRLSKRKLLSNNIHIFNKFNKIYQRLDIFYGTQKLSKYKKIYLFFKKKVVNKKHKIYKKKNFKFHFLLNTYSKVNVLDRHLKRFTLAYFYRNIRKWKYALFPRTEALFYDFVKILSLIEKSLIQPKVLLYVLGLIFKTLHKRKHARFLRFTKEVFKKTIERKSSLVKGIKFIISGRLKGKPRSSISKFQVGRLTLNEVNAKILNSQLHTYTLYGAFGMKLWINYK
jgi:hypothetical protein